jgi:long-chain fatty acid transport protein
MRKLFVFLCVIGLILSGTSTLFGGGADNKTNWSVEYIRTLNRNAATDSADIVMYNPAGVMKMEDGLYGNVSAHYVAKDYNNEINGVDRDQDEPSVVPGLFAVYKKDRWAGFFGVSNVVGGGKVEFDDGNANTNLIGNGLLYFPGAGANLISGAAFTNPPASNLFALFGLNGADYVYDTIKSQNLNAEQTGLGYTLGAAYKISDSFSLALAARFVDTEREFDGTVTIGATNSVPAAVTAASGGTIANPDITAIADFEEDADGWGFVLGFNMAPTDKLNFGVRFESEVHLTFDQDVNVDTRGVLPSFDVNDGGRRNRNLPAIFAVGASYQANPKMRIETNFTYYLNEQADFPDIPTTTRDESAVGNGFDLGVALEYAFSDTLKGSIGYLYTVTGVDAEDMTPELPELDAHTLGAGVAWEVIPNLDVNFGVGQVIYDSESFTRTIFADYTGAPIQEAIRYEKDITFLAFGIQYKFF